MARASCCSVGAVSGSPQGLNGSARTDRATELWDCTYDQRSSMRGILGATTGGTASRDMSTRSPNESQALGISRRGGGVSCGPDGSRKGRRPSMGAGAMVARVIRRVSSRPDDVDDARHRSTRRSHPLCGRTHVVVDGMDGRRAGIGRARGSGEFSESTMTLGAVMIVALLILHGLLAVALLGALTHQAFSVAYTAEDRTSARSSRDFATSTPRPTRPPSCCCSS